MKVETTRKIPAQTVKVTKTVCDFCDFEAKAKCCACGADICRKIKGQHTMYDPREYGDYPGGYCPPCYDIKFKGKFDKEHDRIESEYDNQLEALDRKIKKACLAAKRKREQNV